MSSSALTWCPSFLFHDDTCKESKPLLYNNIHIYTYIHNMYTYTHVNSVIIQYFPDPCHILCTLLLSCALKLYLSLPGSWHLCILTFKVCVCVYMSVYTFTYHNGTLLRVKGDQLHSKECYQFKLQVANQSLIAEDTKW